MDELAGLRLAGSLVGAAGDDAAVVDGLVVTTDMLHETTDFPAGTTRYTAGWRSVGASLSDVAAMGAEATAAVGIYAAPSFEEEELRDFIAGALDVCAATGASYVGGDLDHHPEFTVATTALGRTDDPVRRTGARPGDVVAVTGTLGRSAAAVRLFEQGDAAAGNDLFQFQPRVAAGRALAPYATAMMDSSDGLARSLHQLADASDCGFDVAYGDVPVDDRVTAVVAGEADERELSLFYGEDFELVVTLPPDAVDAARAAVPTDLTVVGSVTESDVLLDGDALPDRGYTH